MVFRVGTERYFSSLNVIIAPACMCTLYIVRHWILYVKREIWCACWAMTHENAKQKCQQICSQIKTKINANPSISIYSVYAFIVTFIIIVLSPFNFNCHAHIRTHACLRLSVFSSVGHQLFISFYYASL